jgi:hypothetical protein
MGSTTNQPHGCSFEKRGPRLGLFVGCFHPTSTIRGFGNLFHEKQRIPFELMLILLRREGKMRRKIGLVPAIAVFLMMIIVNPVIAGDEPQKNEETLKNRVELFLGNTHEEGENAFSTGLSYEYRLHEFFGIGGLVEYAGMNAREWVLAIPLLIHPYKGLRFALAPGLELPKEDKNEFLFRVGVAYEFEIGRWSITPEFNVDFVGGKRLWFMA